MKLVLLTVQTGRVSWLEDLVQSYSHKIGTLVPFEIIYVKQKDHGRDDREIKKAKESDSLLSKLTSKDFVILCDETGREKSSMDFSKFLVKSFESGKARTVVIIGGAYGASPELKSRADFTWKLSSMTLNHWIAQSVVLEQLYRGLTIWKNLPYHND